jgi:hypothetical protein
MNFTQKLYKFIKLGKFVMQFHVFKKTWNEKFVGSNHLKTLKKNHQIS